MSSCKVVILNWNGESHLRRFLPSVVENTPSEVEVVVADNGSTDGSIELLAELFPTVTILKLDHNWGFAEGYNRALSQLDSDYFLLLNSDVECSEGWIEPLIELMDSMPQVAAVVPKLRSYMDREQFEYAGGSGGYIDCLGYPFCRGRILSTIERDCGQYDDCREVFWGSGAALLFRASCFRELGGFDSNFFAHMEEIDLCWRAQLKGYKIFVEPKSVVYHLGGGTLPVGSPRKTFLNHRNNLFMLYKNLPYRQLFIVLIIRFVLDGVAALSYLLKGDIDCVLAVWRAHMEFYRSLSRLRIERRTIQEQTVAESTQIYPNFILLDYILGKKRYSDLP